MYTHTTCILLYDYARYTCELYLCTIILYNNCVLTILHTTMHVYLCTIYCTTIHAALVYYTTCVRTILYTCVRARGIHKYT